MSLVKENFIKILETLPYDLNKEIYNRSTKELLQEITQHYVNAYGIQDLSENDKECIQLLIGKF